MKSEQVVRPTQEPTPNGSASCGDEFLSQEDLVPVLRDAALRSEQDALGELGELMRQCKWEDALALFYPLEEKLPEIVDQGLDSDVRAKIAFVLGQMKRFDEAMTELAVCLERNPDDYHLHNSMAYTAYNSLYAAQNREIFLRGKIRQERIQLAHDHFVKANELRPDGITNHYRQGMLFKQIEGKPDKAIALFEKAVANWVGLSPEQKETRRQEQKNFVKALYHLAGALLEGGRFKRALACIQRCLAEDQKTDHVEAQFKYFALGKVQFHLNAFSEAKNALEFALQCRARRSKDFIYELLARTYLAMGDLLKALETIRCVPEKARRPYCRWTEADILCAQGDIGLAKKILAGSLERDGRSKHKALIRLAKIAYLEGDYHASMAHAAEAQEFYGQRWQNPCEDALFWQALNAYRLERPEDALGFALMLREKNPRYHKLNLLLRKLEQKP